MESTQTASSVVTGTKNRRSTIPYQRLFVIAGPILFLLVGVQNVFKVSPLTASVLGMVSWILLWWITEAVAIPITALLPVILFPLLGVLDLPTAASYYAHPIVLLFLSGFVFAIAMERHRLHERVALYIIQLVGTQSRRLVLGFMVATAFISMWVNNTAATLLMLPIATSVLSLIKEQFEQDRLERDFARFAKSIMLGLAYAASIGGIATVVGTPTNAVLVSFLSERYHHDLNFITWSLIGVPMSVVLLLAAYVIITKIMYPISSNTANASDSIKRKVEALGPATFEQKAVGSVFILTAICWIFRPWLNQVTLLQQVSDTTIGLSAMVLLFVIPKKDGRNTLLSWSDMVNVPWGILLLIGGGMALAKSFEVSGLVNTIGERVASEISNYLPLLAALTLFALIFKQFIGNVALATMMLPMVFGIADAAHIDPLQLGVPITLAASFAFMLPMSTPPNAIVFTTSYVTMRDMLLTGGLLLGVGFIVILAFYKMYALFGIG